MGEGVVREFGMDMHTLLYLKWITNKDILWTQGTLLNVMWQPGWEGSLGENGYMYICVCIYIYICLVEFFCSPPETTTTLFFINFL